MQTPSHFSIELIGPLLLFITNMMFDNLHDNSGAKINRNGRRFHVSTPGKLWKLKRFHERNFKLMFLFLTV